MMLKTVNASIKTVSAPVKKAARMCTKCGSTLKDGDHECSSCKRSQGK